MLLDATMGGRRTDGLLFRRSPSVRHAPIKETLFDSVIHSLIEISWDMKIITLSLLITFKYTITGCRRATVALRGLMVDSTLLHASLHDYSLTESNDIIIVYRLGYWCFHCTVSCRLDILIYKHQFTFTSQLIGHKII